VLVRTRLSARNPGQITGYAVALPANTTPAGGPVWYSGGKLAPDLTLPKLRHRWRDPTASPGLGGQLTWAERDAIWSHAARTAATAADQIRHLAATDPDAAAEAVWTAAGTLHAAAAVLGSRTLSRAADAYDRAARPPHGRIPRPTRAGSDLRHAARLLSALGTTTRDESLTAITLLIRLAALAEAVVDLRHVQRHAAQAAAARTAAERLRAAASPHPAPPRREPTHTRPRTAAQLAQLGFPMSPGLGPPEMRGSGQPTPSQTRARPSPGPRQPRPRSPTR
jgi:hypothetical protein